MRRFFLASLAYLQFPVTLAVLATAALFPRAEGTMLLVSPQGMRPGAMLELARRGGALPAGAGPFAASLLVTGERDRIIAATMRAGIITLAAPEALCGKGVLR